MIQCILVHWVSNIRINHKQNKNDYNTNPCKQILSRTPLILSLHTNDMIIIKGQYADSLFEAYQNDPNSVEKSWREYFDKYHGYFSSGEFLNDADAPSDVSNENALKMITDATNLLKYVRSYQAYGHYIAKLDPLGILEQGVDRKQFMPELLKKEHWGFTNADYDRKIYIGDHSQFLQLMGVASPYVTLREVENKLQEIYCGTIGYQYMHIANFQKNQFMRKTIEREIQDYQASKEEKIRILDRLLWAEEFENFLDVKYPAQKRFGELFYHDLSQFDVKYVLDLIYRN